MHNAICKLILLQGICTSRGDEGQPWKVKDHGPRISTVLGGVGGPWGKESYPRHLPLVRRWASNLLLLVCTKSIHTVDTTVINCTFNVALVCTLKDTTLINCTLNDTLVCTSKDTTVKSQYVWGFSTITLGALLHLGVTEYWKHN